MSSARPPGEGADATSPGHLPTLAERLIGAPGRQEWRQNGFVVVASVVGIMIAQFHVYSLGVMMEPLEQTFGWGRAQINSGLFIISIIVFPLAPLMGVAIDRLGPRRIALCGVTIYALSLALLSLAQQSLWTWWLLWSLVAVGTLFIKPTVWLAGVASLFEASRGLALAVTLSASGMAAFFLPLVTVGLVESFGWRGAYLSLGLLAALVGLPVLFSFFSSAADEQRRSGAGVSGGDRSAALRPSRRLALWNPALRRDFTSPAFIRLVAASLIVSAASLGLIVNMVPLLTASGTDLRMAAAIGGLLGIAQVAGRLSTGFLLDRFDARWIGALSFCLPSLTLLILLAAAGSVPLAMLAVILFGLSVGAEMDVIAYLAARYFGTGNFGAVFGVIVGVIALGGGTGPILVGLVFDLTGSYGPALMGLIPLTLFSGSLIWGLGAYPAPGRTGAEAEV